MHYQEFNKFTKIISHLKLLFHISLFKFFSDAVNRQCVVSIVSVMISDKQANWRRLVNDCMWQPTKNTVIKVKIRKMMRIHTDRQLLL
jgi:hypothetical protein